MIFKVHDFIQICYVINKIQSANSLVRKIEPSMFEGEAIGLNAMYNTKSVRVPQPFKVESSPSKYLFGNFIFATACSFW